MRSILYVTLAASLAANVFLGLRFLPGCLHDVAASSAGPASDTGAVAASAAGGAYLKLQNVRFFWSDEISVETRDLSVRAVPIAPHTSVDFDNVAAYRLELLNGDANLRLTTLQHILNEIVFAYDGSPLRNLKLSTRGDRLVIQGELDFVFWLGFEMVARLSLSDDRRTLWIDSEGVTALGMPFAGDLLSSIGLDLEALVPVPPNHPLRLTGNRMIVDPYRLFPQPAFSGNLTAIYLHQDHLQLRFRDTRRIAFPRAPVPESTSGLYIYQGGVKFGKLRMVDTRLQMVDTDPDDFFDFFAKRYHEQLIRSEIRITLDRQVVARVPDYGAWQTTDARRPNIWAERLAAGLAFLDQLPLPDIADMR